MGFKNQRKGKTMIGTGNGMDQQQPQYQDNAWAGLGIK
jgi:hypothetical protein